MKMRGIGAAAAAAAGRRVGGSTSNSITNKLTPTITALSSSIAGNNNYYNRNDWRTLTTTTTSSPPFPNSNSNSNSYSNSSSLFARHFSSPGGPSNIVLVESEDQFTSSLRKVQDESLPAVFYFTATWCPPCKLLSPVIGQLSEKYPHVTTFKVDIDKEELGRELSKLDINSVPRLHFFQNGKRDSEIIGADVQRIKDTMEKLYG